VNIQKRDKLLRSTCWKLKLNADLAEIIFNFIYIFNAFLIVES